MSGENMLGYTALRFNARCFGVLFVCNLAFRGVYPMNSGKTSAWRRCLLWCPERHLSVSFGGLIGV